MKHPAFYIAVAICIPFGFLIAPTLWIADRLRERNRVVIVPRNRTYSSDNVMLTVVK